MGIQPVAPSAYYTTIPNNAEQLGSKSRLHNHGGRESFATLYLENGGSLEVLQEYLCHSFTETTMKYVHVCLGCP
ncbi:MAG: tyrosine-type recombinase/integrase [Janthinobacterium lividum]